MKQVYILTLLLMMAGTFGGCGDDNRQTPYVMGERAAVEKPANTAPAANKSSAVTIATIEAETQKEVAKINKERDLELQKMQHTTKLVEIKAQNEMAEKEHNLSVSINEGEIAFKNSTLLVGSLTILLFFVLSFYIFKKRREDKMKMHDDVLQKEMYIREKELQVQMAEKILDTIASGKLSAEREQHLLETLDKTTPSLPHNK